MSSFYDTSDYEETMVLLRKHNNTYISDFWFKDALGVMYMPVEEAVSLLVTLTKAFNELQEAGAEFSPVRMAAYATWDLQSRLGIARESNVAA